jgi:hypothetical protein
MNTSILNGITPQKMNSFTSTTLKNDSMELIFELSPLPFDFYEPGNLVDMFSFLKELLP